MYQITPYRVSNVQVFIAVNAHTPLNDDAIDSIISTLMRITMTQLGIFSGSLNTEEFASLLGDMQTAENTGVYVAHNTAGYPEVAYGKIDFISEKRVEFSDNLNISRHISLNTSHAK
jgi:dTDP-glucose pyrophosphorylase